MKISQEQYKVIENLTCERLSSNEDNFKLIDCFENIKNNAIVSSLKNEAWAEDENSVTAYYVVKDSKDEVVFFFSLKCGSLFTSLDDERLRIASKLQECIEEILQDENEEEREIALIIREKFRERKHITDGELQYILDRHSSIFDEMMDSSNPNIARVGATYSGVELVHFCINDNASSSNRLREFFAEQHFGAVVFWSFIVPKVIELRKLVGCQYLFLFAADESVDEHLVNYYRDLLKFEVPTEIGINKPFYDFNCKFMCQEAEGLEAKKDYFFEHFNRDASEDDV